MDNALTLHTTDASWAIKIKCNKQTNYKPNLPRTKMLEMSSRLTHEHFDFPSSTTNRKGPCLYDVVRPPTVMLSP